MPSNQAWVTPAKRSSARKKKLPLLPQRFEFFLPCGGQAVVTAVAPGGIGLPTAFDPAALFEVVEHGVERSQREVQCPFGPFLNLPGDFETVKRLVGQQRKNGKFGAAAGDL